MTSQWVYVNDPVDCLKSNLHCQLFEEKALKPESSYKRKRAGPKFSLSSTQAAFVFLLQKSKQHEQHMDLFVNMHMSRRGLM